MNELADMLIRRNACKDGIAWAQALPEDTSVYNAWRKCPRGDWLLWIANTFKFNKRQIIYAACKCARLSLPYAMEGDFRPQQCLEVVEAWHIGEASINDVLASYNTACEACKDANKASVDSSYYSAASACATAVANVVYATAYATHAAPSAAYVSGYAAWVSSDGDPEEDEEAVMAECARIVRKEIPWRDLKIILQSVYVVR